MIEILVYLIIGFFFGVAWLVGIKRRFKRDIETYETGYAMVLMVAWPFILVFCLFYCLGYLLMKGVNKL